jgi:GH15 family glucan-1,4-alpha-glucosidase
MFIGAEALGRIEQRLWPRWRMFIEHVETIWREPDEGIWEARGPQRHYTYFKVMAWVVFDRAVRLAERYGLEAPVDRWKRIREETHREVCERGYDRERRTVTQYYGSNELDASVLNIPLVGFLRGTDGRVSGTIVAVWRELGRDGFVSRYSTAETDDGLPGDEGQFLACWLARSRATAVSRRRERCSSGSSAWPMISAFSARSTTWGAGGKSATSRLSHLTLIVAAREVSAAESSAKRAAG